MTNQTWDSPEENKPYETITDLEKIKRYFEYDENGVIDDIDKQAKKGNDNITLEIYIRAEDQYAGYCLDFGENDSPIEDDDYCAVRRFLELEPCISITQSRDGDVRIYLDNAEYYQGDCDMIEFVEEEKGITPDTLHFVERDLHDDGYRYIFEFTGKTQTKQELREELENFYCWECECEPENVFKNEEDFEKTIWRENCENCVFPSGDILLTPAWECCDGSTYLMKGWYENN